MGLETPSQSLGYTHLVLLASLLLLALRRPATTFRLGTLGLAFIATLAIPVLWVGPAWDSAPELQRFSWGFYLSFVSSLGIPFAGGAIAVTLLARRQPAPSLPARVGWTAVAYLAGLLASFPSRSTTHSPTPSFASQTMHTLLWVLQVLAALLYLASGTMKVFMFDRIKDQVPSFGALPRQGWQLLGLVELVCAPLLVAPGALGWHPELTVVAATVLALESLVFIWVHVRYRETGSIIMSGTLGLIMAFVAWCRR